MNSRIICENTSHLQENLLLQSASIGRINQIQHQRMTSKDALNWKVHMHVLELP